MQREGGKQLALGFGMDDKEIQIVIIENSFEIINM